MKKKLYVWILFLLFFSVSYGYTFTETFGNSKVTYTDSSGYCDNTIGYNYTKLDAASQVKLWDNNYVCEVPSYHNFTMSSTTIKDGEAITDYGLEWINDGSQARNLYHMFSFPIKLLNDSVIEYSCKDWLGQVFLVFGNQQGIIGAFPLSNSTSAQCNNFKTNPGNNNAWCVYFDSLSNFNYCNQGNGVLYNNTIIVSDILANGSLGAPAFTLNNLSGIDYFSLRYYGLTENTTTIIDDLSLTYYANGSNTYPSFNVSYNNTCFNKTIGTADINFKIESYDTEGDTVYHSSQVFDQLRRYTYLEEDFNSYDFLYSDNLLYNSSVSLVEDPNSFFGYYTFGFNYPDQENMFIDLDIGEFGVETKIPAWEIRTDDIIYDTSDYSFRLILPYEDTYLSFQTLNEYNQEFMNFSINRTTNDQIEVYLENSLLFTYPIDDYTEDWLDILIVTAPNNNTPNMAIQFTNYSEDVVYTVWHNYTYDGVKGLQFTNRNTDNSGIRDYYYRFDQIVIKGWNVLNEPGSWTTDNTFTLEVDKKGSFQADVYISDSRHDYNNGEYIKEVITSNILECQYFTDPSSRIDSEDALIPLLSHIKNNIGGPLQDYVIAMDLYETGKGIIWLIFIFLFVSTIIGEYMFIRRIDFIFPLLSAAIPCAFISFLMDYTALYWSYLIMVALSLAGPMAMSMLAGGRR